MPPPHGLRVPELLLRPPELALRVDAAAAAQDRDGRAQPKGHATWKPLAPALSGVCHGKDMPEAQGRVGGQGLGLHLVRVGETCSVKMPQPPHLLSMCGDG